MPTPGIGRSSQMVSTEFEQRRFYIKHGWSERESVQVRLDPRNQHVYVDYTENESRRIVSATVPFETFVAEFKKWVDGLKGMTT